MLRYKFHSPAMTRQYGLSAFFADLKTVVQLAGIEGHPIVLYIEDRQVGDDDDDDDGDDD
jgi:dynein heavy chain 2, cytosolic